MLLAFIEPLGRLNYCLLVESKLLGEYLFSSYFTKFYSDKNMTF